MTLPRLSDPKACGYGQVSSVRPVKYRRVQLGELIGCIAIADVDRAVVSLPIKEIDCRHRRLEQDAFLGAEGPRQGISVGGGCPNQQVDDWGTPGPPQNLPQRRLLADVRKRHGKRIAGDVN